VNANSLEKLKISRQRRERQFSNQMTRFSGTMTFVGLHVIWFGAWIVFNVSSAHPFDRFPFGLLTLIVSLEAIFLSTFVLMTQNESAARDDERARKDHQTNLWSEVWSEMIGEQLGIKPADVRKRYEQRLKEDQGAAPGDSE
jgi:uncharacterized membrane protein